MQNQHFSPWKRKWGPRFFFGDEKTLFYWKYFFGVEGVKTFSGTNSVFVFIEKRERAILQRRKSQHFLQGERATTFFGGNDLSDISEEGEYFFSFDKKRCIYISNSTGTSSLPWSIILFPLPLSIILSIIFRPWNIKSWEKINMTLGTRMSREACN